ncbi:hypothetical protein [Psychromonas ossibalaenae]|uniref:hypothetical protein n=1 Tax=Psychromonas ossibalaenae TaxID=444922 RepID=UPI000371B64D|nr:hypothetical protein [Psychromonas ossibalaenae]
MVANIFEEITSGYALEKYSDRNRLLGEAVPYIGEARQSASDPGKVFLRLSPLSSNGELLEFKTEDVLFAENVETVADKEGETFQIVKIWVRIGSIGIRLEPFSVQDYSNVLDKGFDALTND